MVSEALLKARKLRSLLETVEHQQPKELIWIRKLGTELKNLGEYQFADENEVDELTTCLVLYVEVLFNFSLRNAPSKKNIMIIKYLFGAILELINSVELKNAFLIKGTAKIFEILLDNIRPWFAKPLLSTYNGIIQGSDRKVRSDVLNSMGIMVLFKLIDTLSIYGDYEYQAMIIETLYRICSVDVIEKHSAQFIPESAELSRVLSTINTKEFDEDVRKFLNMFNSEKNTIFSTKCAWIKLDDLIVNETMLPEGVWIDFDLIDCSISWNCRRSLIEDLESNVIGTEATDWEYITLLGDHVQSYDIKRLKKKLLVTMHLNGPCMATSADLQSILDKMTSLQFLINDSSITSHVIVNVLPKMFKKTRQVQKTSEVTGKKRFSRTSARGYSPLKIVYTSLKKDHRILDRSGSNWSITHSTLEQTNIDDRPVEERSVKEDSMQSNVAQIQDASDSSDEYETDRLYSATQNISPLNRLVPEINNRPANHEKHFSMCSKKFELRFSRSKTVVSDEFNWSDEIPLARIMKNHKVEEKISFDREGDLLKENAPDKLHSVDNDIDLVNIFSGMIRNKKLSMPQSHRIERNSFDDLKTGTRTTVSERNEQSPSDLKKDKSVKKTDIKMSEGDQENDCGNGNLAVVCSEKSNEEMVQSIIVSDRVNVNDILDTDCAEPEKPDTCDEESYNRSKSPSIVTNYSNGKLLSVNKTPNSTFDKSQNVNEVLTNSAREISYPSFTKQSEVRAPLLHKDSNPISGSKKFYKSDKNLHVNFTDTEHEKNIEHMQTSNKRSSESTKKYVDALTLSKKFNPSKKQELYVALEEMDLNAFEELTLKKKTENVLQFDGNLSRMSKKRKLFDPNDLSLIDLSMDSNEDVKRTSPYSASKMRRISLTLKVNTYERCPSKPENRTSNKKKRKRTNSKKQNKRKSLSEVCQALDKMKKNRIAPERNQKVGQLPWTFSDLLSKLEKSTRYFNEPKEKIKNLKKPKRNSKNQKNRKSTFFDTIQRNRADTLDDSLSSLRYVKDEVIARNCTPDVEKIKKSLLTSDLEPKPIRENSNIKIISDVLVSNKFQQEISKAPPEPYPHALHLGTSFNVSEEKEEDYAKLQYDRSSIQTESKKQTLKLFSDLFVDIFAKNKKSPENQELVFRSLENIVSSLNK